MPSLIDFIDTSVEKIVGRKLNKGFLQFFRYLICGGIATVSDMGVLYVSTHFLHIYYLFAAACGFILGVVINYTLNIILVFKSTGKIKREFALFALIGIGGLIWTEAIIWTLVDKLNFYIMIAKMTAVIFVLFWNFFMRKKFVFYPEPVTEEYIDYS
jgi:putative flippase GtrA